MKTATLTIGKPRTQRNPRNVFVLEVKYMHGDADAYTSEAHRYAQSRIEQLKKDILLLNAATSYEFDRYHGRSLMEKILSEQTGLSVEDAGAFIEDFWEGDATCDHQYMAAFDDWSLTFFDEHGVEHTVEVAIA